MKKILELLLLKSGGVVAPTTYLSDTFTGTNGTAIASHSPDVNTGGNAWIGGGAGMEIQSNQLSIIGASGIGQALIDTEQADFILAVQMITGATTGLAQRVYFRHADTSNEWLLLVAVSTNTFELYKRVGGSLSQEDFVTVSPVLAVDTSYAIRVECNGDSITCTLDGANELSLTDAANNTATKIILYGQNGTKFDNITQIEV